MSTVRRGIALALVLAAPALADAQVLTFEGISDFSSSATAPIGNFYNGGAGPNFGVEFSPNALALCLNTATRQCSNGSRGGRGDPASQGTALFFLSGASTFMNRAAGFNDGFSFFYGAPFGTPGSFSVWSDLNGTGTLLGTVALPLTAQGPGPCFGAQGCPFFAAGLAFSGTARSVTFEGVANEIAFDDVTFGSATPGPTTTPEPATTMLLATGLAALTWVARRRRGAR
jgi:hypothetical protein